MWEQMPLRMDPGLILPGQRRNVGTRRLVAHHALAVVADVPIADVIAPNDEDIWFVGLSHATLLWLTCVFQITRSVDVSSPIAPLYEAQQHGEESEYSDEGKNDRYREQRCLLSLSRSSRDHRKVSAPKVTKPPVLLPNRNHQSHDAAEDQRKAEVARRMGEIRGLDPWRLLDASEKLDDGEAESD